MKSEKKTAKRTKRAIRTEQRDPIAAFIEDRCERIENAIADIEELYEEWKDYSSHLEAGDWCGEPSQLLVELMKNGLAMIFGHRPERLDAFGIRLKSRSAGARVSAAVN